MIPSDTYRIYGPEVERTECRGFGRYSTPYMLNIDEGLASAPGGLFLLNEASQGRKPPAFMVCTA